MPRKKPPVTVQPADYDGALKALTHMSKTPRETELEQFVRTHLDVFQQAIANGYTHSDICDILRRNHITGTSTTALGKAFKKYGVGVMPTSAALANEEDDMPQVS